MLDQVNDALSAASIALQFDGLDRFLQTLVRHAAEIVGASAGWVTLPSADGTQYEIVGPCRRETRSGQLVPVASAERILPMVGFAKDVRAAINAAGEFCWQRLDQQGIPPPLRRRYQGQREALRVAIRFGETRFGHLALLFAGRGRPSEARVHAMRALAHQAAVAIGLQRQRENACRGESRAAVEAERTRMAGEIHDGIAQAFLAVLMQARAARLPVRRHGRAVLRFLDGIESAAADGLEEARRSAFALRSVPVARHGLVHALERLVGSFATGGPTRFVFVNGAGAPSPSHAVEDAAYRIVQEAMQNAVKHAGASLVTVRLDRHDDRLRLRIEDDGEGIAQDLVQRARERGGLRGMRERAEQCGGSLVVETGSPRGMRIHVLLPLENTLK